MIRTNEFVISKKDMMKLMLYQTFKAYKWIFLILLAIGIYSLTEFHKDSASRFMVIFCIIYPFFIAGSVYLTLTSKSNRVFFKPRTHVFEEYKLHCIVGDQTVVDAQIRSEYTYDSIIKKDFFSGYWLLYVAKTQAMPVPVSAFQNEADLNGFIELMNKKVK